MNKFICTECKDIHDKKKKMCICGNKKFEEVDGKLSRVVRRLMKEGCHVSMEDTHIIVGASREYVVITAMYSAKCVKILNDLYTRIAADINIGTRVNITLTRESSAKDKETGSRVPEMMCLRVVSSVGIDAIIHIMDESTK